MEDKMGPVGVKELLLILLLVLLLFGAKKIPELAKGLGIGLKEFRKATKEVDDDNAKSASDLPAKEKSSVNDGNS
jgi:sec-independent protein translocase protein TatA